MGRVLIWILLGALAYAMMRSWARIGTARGRREARAPEAMVRCETCGLNVPQSDAFSRGGRWFCSREHLEGTSSGG
jgi:uncharacterized protein